MRLHHGQLRMRLLLAATTLQLAGCGRLAVDAGDGMPQIQAVAIQSGTVNLVHHLSVTLGSPGLVEVEYWAADTPRLRRVADSSALDHQVVLVQLLGATAYQYAVYPVAENGRRGAPTVGSFATDPLPQGLADLSAVSSGVPTYPLTMFEISQQPSFAGFVAFDARGRVVWYRRSTGGATGFTRRQNGNFVFLDGAGLTEETPDGRAVAQLPHAADGRGFHHDVVATPQNTLHAITKDPRPFGDSVLTGETIWEWNPEQGTVTKRWSAFDFLPPAVNRGPRSRPTDWLHGNALAMGPRGNVVISLPFLNQIVSIRSDFQALEWRLGGYGADITVAGDGQFSGQHTAAEIAPGHVLMFDNGWDRGVDPPYSRALELELDLTDHTARPIWSFRAPADNYSGAISSARRLPNGNTLVQFGLAAGILNSTGPVEVYEVTAGGATQWHLRFENLQVSYRATPLPHLAGEVAVSGTSPESVATTARIIGRDWSARLR